MDTYQMLSSSNSIQEKRTAFERDRDRMRAMTKHKVHALLLGEFIRFSESMPAARTKLHEITGIPKAMITRMLSGARNLTTDSIADMLLGMESRLGVTAVDKNRKGNSNYIHPMSTLGDPSTGFAAEKAGGSAPVASFQVTFGKPAVKQTLNDVAA